MFGALKAFREAATATDDELDQWPQAKKVKALQLAEKIGADDPYVSREGPEIIDPLVVIGRIQASEERRIFGGPQSQQTIL